MKAKLKFTYSHAGHLLGCFLLAIYCLIALIMTFDTRSEYGLLAQIGALPFTIALTSFFCYECYHELLWLLEHEKEENHND